MAVDQQFAPFNPSRGPAIRGGPIRDSFTTGSEGIGTRQFNDANLEEQQLLNQRQSTLNKFLGQALGGMFGEGGSGGSGGGFGSPGYANLLGEQRSDRDALLGEVAGFGDSFRNKLERDFDASSGSIQARLEDRGLGSSNLAGVGESANAEARAQSMLGLEDSLLQNRLGLAQNLNQGIYNTQLTDLGNQSALSRVLLGGLF